MEGGSDGRRCYQDPRTLKIAHTTLKFRASLAE